MKAVIQGSFVLFKMYIYLLLICALIYSDNNKWEAWNDRIKTMKYQTFCDNNLTSKFVSGSKKKRVLD